ncbi:MAG TPA: hypothetical protein VK253_01405 [Candidatus Binatia bacterium]|nr:hypothetical protein [Candidatus Binatia bacterium]
MVNIIEDWDILAEYSGERLGFFQILLFDGMVEIRVLTGKVAFKREFKSREDPEYNKILEHCRKNRYIKVTTTAWDQQFFK